MPKVQQEVMAGMIVLGVVVSKSEYGYFVKILKILGENGEKNPALYDKKEELNGIGGFLHFSEVSWSDSSKNYSRIGEKMEVFQVGDKIEAYVLSIDKDRKRNNVALSVKRCGANLFQEFANAHKEGDILEANIIGFPKFGVVLDIYKGLSGVILAKDLSWQSRDNQVKNMLQDKHAKNEPIQAKIINIDHMKERVNLSLKEMEKDPLEAILKKYPVGSVIEGKVSTKMPFLRASFMYSTDVFLDIDEFEAIAVIKKSKRSRSNFPRKSESKEIVKAKITGIDPQLKILIVSVDDYFEDLKDQAVEKYGEGDNSYSMNKALQDFQEQTDK